MLGNLMRRPIEQNFREAGYAVQAIVAILYPVRTDFCVEKLAVPFADNSADLEQVGKVGAYRDSERYLHDSRSEVAYSQAMKQGGRGEHPATLNLDRITR